MSRSKPEVKQALARVQALRTNAKSSGNHDRQELLNALKQLEQACDAAGMQNETIRIGLVMADIRLDLRQNSQV